MTIPPHDRSPEFPAAQPARLIPVARPLPAPMARPLPPPDPMLLTGLSRGRAALHLLGLLLLGFLPMLLIGIALGIHAAANGADTPPASLPEEFFAEPAVMMGVTVAIGLFLVIGILVMLRLSRAPADAIGLTTRDLPVNTLLGPGVTAATFLGFIACAGVFQVVWPEGLEQLQSNPERIKTFVPELSTAQLLLLMLAVAAYEEVIFRGFILTHLRRITGSWVVATLLAAVVFALMHVGESAGTQTWATFYPLVVMAVLWSAVTIWRRSLVPAIVGHALFNSVQLLFLRAQG